MATIEKSKEKTFNITEQKMKRKSVNDITIVDLKLCNNMAKDEFVLQKELAKKIKRNLEKVMSVKN